MLTPDQIEANQEGIAAAIRSIALANALTWAAVATLLDKEGVMPIAGFVEMTDKLAELIDLQVPDESNAGSAMLRQVHNILRKQNPRKFKPKVVG